MKKLLKSEINSILTSLQSILRMTTNNNSSVFKKLKENFFKASSKHFRASLVKSYQDFECNPQNTASFHASMIAK